MYGRQTGEGPRVLIPVSGVSLRESLWCPTLVMAQTRRLVTISPTNSRNLLSTMSRSWKFLWCTTGWKHFLWSTFWILHGLWFRMLLTLFIRCNFRTYCAEIAHNISTRKRKEIVERAAQLDVVVTNKLARLRSQEDEWALERLWVTLLCVFPSFSILEEILFRILFLFSIQYCWI